MWLHEEGQNRAAFTDASTDCFSYPQSSFPSFPFPFFTAMTRGIQTDAKGKSAPIYVAKCCQVSGT